MSGTRPSLRERTKARTRREIQIAALTLFAEQGYEASTIPAIAEAADVAPRTVSLYFPSKLDLFAGDPGAQAQLTHCLSDNPDLIAGLDDWLIARVSSADPEIDRLRYTAIRHDQHLRALEREQLDVMEDTIAAAVAHRIDEAPDGVGPRTFAAATIGALLSFRAFLDVDETGYVRAHDRAFALLRTLLNAADASESADEGRDMPGTRAAK